MKGISMLDCGLIPISNIAGDVFRMKLLFPIAKRIEFTSVFLMSATDKGYKMRLARAIEAIESLANERVWEVGETEYGHEDSKALVTTFRKMVRGR